MRFLAVLAFVENVFSIYRNYIFYNKFTRTLVLLRIMYEIVFIILNMIRTTEKIIFSRESIYLFLNAIYSALILLMAIYHTRPYKKLVMYFKSFDIYFPKSTQPIQKFVALKVLVAIDIVWVLMNLVSFSYLNFFVFGGPIDIGHIYDLILFISVCKCRLRFIIETCVMSYTVNSIGEQLVVIVKAIEDEAFDLRVNGEVNVAFVYESSITVSQVGMNRLQLFDTWSAAYATIRKCSELCNNIFGLQATFMLATTSIYYIILLYSIITLGLKGNFSPVLQSMFILSLAEFMLALYILSQSAQRAHNSAVTLRRRLASLLLHSIECKEQYKAARDLLRLVSTHPIRTKAFGSIMVDMALLPTCIAFCTSYTVIALQFNNIL